MPRTIVIETDSHGYPVKIIRRHSHHHIPHPHLHWDSSHHHSDKDDSAMRDRIRQLEEANSILHRENASLKSSLNGAESDLRHQRETITALQINVRNLAVENGDLRRSLEAYESHSSQHKDHERELRLKLARVESDNSALRDRNSRLETENKVLRDRIQGLIREVKEGIDERVKELGREVKEWRRRWEDSERRLGRMRGNWDIVLREREDLRIENSALRRANTLLERRLWRRGLL